MNEWTPNARAVLEQHLNHHRARFAADGAEADEVIGDLRLHLEREAAALKLSVVTEDDVRRILARVAPDLLTMPRPGLPTVESNHPTSPEARPGPPAFSRAWEALLWIFGVLLPLGTLLFEWTTRACAAELLDPVPTVLHALLIALVPATHAIALIWLGRTTGGVPTWLAWMQSVALGVAGAYALIFLPFSPIALVGIVFLGFGFLPLSPLLAWICGLMIGSRLKKRAQATQSSWPRHRWVGWAGAMTLLGVLALPAVMTREWLDEAVTHVGAEREQAIRRLRSYGDNEVLLKACYGQRRQIWDEVFSRQWISAEQAQEVYFRVVGQPFNAVRPPLGRLRGAGREVLRDFEWDNAVGGEAVAGHVSGLSLLSSRLDAKGNADDGWAYTEWTLEFRNDHERQPREARAEIQLPPGGVVSRVTLWVNGEEREAAFAGRGEVRAAYQQVAVVQRRDPILVTTSGPDRVLMQCFPVPAQGGTMKVRLGITAPLAPLDRGHVSFVWPRFAERNFAIREDLRHHAWLETPRPATGVLAGWTLDANSSNALHAAVRERDAAAAFPAIRLPRDSGMVSAWARDDRAAAPAWVRQHLGTGPARVQGRLAIVLDGGRGGRAAFEAVRDALKQVGGQGGLGVWIAYDGVIEVAKTNGGHLEGIIGAIEGRIPTFAGGHDPVPALEAAWDWAAQVPGSTVLWVHGPQPVLLGGAYGITQRLERTWGTGTQLLDFQAGLGPNRIARETAGIAGYSNVPRLGSVTEDLVRLLQQWNGAAPNLVWQTERTETDPGSVVTASRHLVRLWALERIQQLRHERLISDAVDLAARWQLVTPVSGAVVLESKAQFTQAGLTPVDPLTTPSIVPEPETWALLIFGAAAVWFRSRRTPSRRRTRSSLVSQQHSPRR